MSKLTELQEKRATLAAKIKEQRNAYVENGNAWRDDSQRSNWKKLNEDYDANKAELERELEADAVDKRAAAIDEEMNRRTDDNPIPGREDTRHRKPIGGDGASSEAETHQLAVRGWMAAQMGWSVDARTQEQYDAAMRSCNIRPWQSELPLRVAQPRSLNEIGKAYRSGHILGAEERAEAAWEKRAMSAGLFASGGGLIFPSLMKRLEINMLAFGGLRQAATTLTTDTGEEMGMPTADDTSNKGAMIGENQSVGTSTEPSVGQIKWGAYTFTSKPVLVPFGLLQDTLFDLGSMLGDMLGERIGRITNDKYTTGIGSKEPKGIVTAASKGADAITGGAIKYGDFVNLEHSIDPAYRSGAGYMLHDTTLQAVRLLLDSQNRPLWTSGTDTNSFDRLMFKPLFINQSMDAGTTSGNKAVLYGQLNRYYIRRAGGARLYRLQERYRDTDQDGFVMLLREDGNLLNAGTMPVKYLLC